MSNYIETHKQLGFDSIEKMAVVSSLNKLLANYQVHYQKLRNFHWNVKGGDFFDLHQQFEDEYNTVKSQIDEIAERVRTFGATPYSKLSEYLTHAEIEEVASDFTSIQMVNEVIEDYDALLGYLMDAIDKAKNIGDVGTLDMITAYMKRMEKRRWMFSAFLNRS